MDAVIMFILFDFVLIAGAQQFKDTVNRLVISTYY